MVFTLVSTAQEWLNVLSDDRRKKAEAKEEKRLRDEEEAERVSNKSQFMEGTVLIKQTAICNKSLT